jgi:hypothetical protein
MQRQHLRNYSERAVAGLNFSRQIIASCDVDGQCDISAMDHAVNAYLRRHDTFRSWFERTGDGEFVRHAITDPADIEFVPIDQGHMTVDEIRAHVVAIPSPLDWGCFTFGIIQNEKDFTFFAAMDHVHGDATLIGTTMMEANGMYSALSEGGEALMLPDAGSYDDFCVREREYTHTLTLDSPGVRAWIDFSDNNGDGFPEFPLPLGNPLEATSSDMTSEILMDPAQTQRFESACAAAGARFVGGLFACLGLVEHEFTGALTYYGLTPRDSRTASDHRSGRGDLFQRRGLGSADFLRFGPEHGTGAVLPRIGVGAVVELAAAELSGFELLARWRRPAQRRPGRGRHGPCEQYRDLS